VLATQPPADNDGSQTVTPASTTSQSLPFTGADVVGTVVLGVALIGGGALLVRISRRRHRAI
jgi:LPXTG-motif cell wall-anchored protein